MTAPTPKNKRLKDGRTHPWRSGHPVGAPESNAEKVIPKRHAMLRKGRP